jgi:hypothetical protein
MTAGHLDAGARERHPRSNVRIAPQGWAVVPILLARAEPSQETS